MTLDEEYVVFTSSLGEAVAMWAVVENDIRNVTCLCFKDEDQNRDAISIAFVKLESFRAKLALADGVVLTKIAEDHIHDWVALVQRARTLSDSRNKIAHFPVGIYEHARPGRRVVLGSWLVDPGATKPRNGRTPASSAIGTNEVLKIIENFAALSNALQNLAARVRGQPEPRPKSAERASHRTTAQARLRLIHEELGHPQQSSKEKRRLESEKNAAASLRAHLTGKEGDDPQAK